MTSMLDPLCERARAWASLDLDDDLGEIERVLLDDHLARCSGCAAFVAGMRELTAVVRAAPQEQPRHRPLMLPVRRRPARLATRVAAAAAVVALSAGLAFLGTSLARRGDPATTTTDLEIAFLPVVSFDQEDKSLRATQPPPDLERVGPPGRLGAVV
jgi:predicted anti-sigma-YlaC factor YlaD